MISSKLFAVVVTASALWVVDAGKCKPHPNPTSFLTLTSGDSPATSSSVSYFTSSRDDVHVFSSTDSLGSSRLTGTASSGISESPATPSYQTPTSSPTASDSTTASVSTASSDNVIVEAPTFSSSFTTVVSLDITTLVDSSTTADIITTSIDDFSSTEVSTSTEVASTHVTTTASTTVFTSETTTTTENLWTSTTAASCPVYSMSLNDPSFEGDNTGPDRWDYMGQFANVAVPFQKENSMSEKVPRAHRESQFALLSTGPGSKLGSDMWRPMSLDPTKKYQVWFAFAAVSDPEEDYYFNFIIATRMYGHASRETIIVPKGSPFVYRQQSTIIQGAQGDNLYAFIRANAGSNPRLVAVDDIYVAEYVPSCSVPTEKSDLCGGIQSSSISTQAYRTVYLDQGSVEVCTRLCMVDESCKTFGWRAEQFGRACYLYKAPMESLGIKPNDKGAFFYDRTCGQCTGLDCYPS